MTLPILRPVHRWWCPNCRREAVTHETRPESHLHPCPKLRGLYAPMIPAGTQAKVTLREREDYVGKEMVTLDPERGRPVMSIVTERPDGSNDAMVFAPAAVAKIGEM